MSSNMGKKSDWYTRSEERAFIDLLQPGDLIEFHRGLYSHWGVYVGDQRSKGRFRYTLANRTNPGPKGSNNYAFHASMGVSSPSLPVCGGGIQYDDLLIVWGQDTVRLNNSMDHKHTPRSAEEILELIDRAVQGSHPLSNLAYNLVDNNCETFANYTRNGIALSNQAETGTWAVLGGIGVLLGGALLANLLHSGNEKEDEEDRRVRPYRT